MLDRLVMVLLLAGVRQVRPLRALPVAGARRVLLPPRAAASTTFSEDDLLPGPAHMPSAPAETGAAVDSFFGARVPFAELGLDAELVARLADAGFLDSTAIQARALPAVLAGGDVVIAAETGSGKTLSYLLPVLHRTLHTPRVATVDQGEGTEEPAQEPPPLAEDDLGLVSGRADWDQGAERAATAGARDWTPPTAWTQAAPAKPPVQDSYPRVLVLVPNRELVQQVLSMANPLIANLPVTVGAVSSSVAQASTASGAPPRWPFFQGRRESPDVLVCTPTFVSRFGKLLPLFAALDAVVFDEADMLLDGGFIKQIDEILLANKRVRRECLRPTDAPPPQMILAAATLPNYGLKSVDELVARRFPKARRVQNELMHHTHPQLTQDWLPVGRAEDGLRQALEVLDRERAVDPDPRTMVFVNTANAAEDVCLALQDAGFATAAYHKNVKPDQREANLRRFAGMDDPTGPPVSVLVCTDLASRGLDIPGVKHVLQLEFATNVVQHLHRLGRTGRAGQPGRATHFYAPSSELAALIRDASDNNAPLEESFSRKRGFRKKIKKLGKPHNARARPRA